jgi:hypothetical protein
LTSEAAKRDLGLLCQHERDGLSTEQDLVSIEGPKRRPVRRYIILVGVIRIGHVGPVLVRENFDDAADAQGLGQVDAPNPSLGDA